MYFLLVLNFATVIYVLSINVKLYIKKKKKMLVGKLELNPKDLFDPQRIDSVNLKLLNLLKILQLRFYSAETMQFSIFKHIL